MPPPPHPHFTGMKPTVAGRSGLRVTASTAASGAVRTSLLSKAVTHGTAFTSSRLAKQKPLTHGRSRQQDHWLTDSWPHRAPFPLTLTTATASPVEAEPQVAEGNQQQKSEGRRSLDVRPADAPLPDEPQTPTQSSEAPFLDAAAAASSSSESDSPRAEVQDASSSSSSSSSSPASDAVGTGSGNSVSKLDPSIKKVVAAILVPTALVGWMMGPGGSKCRATQREDCAWWFSSREERYQHLQGLRLLMLQGTPEGVAQRLEAVLADANSEDAPFNKKFFRTKDSGQFKVRLVMQSWLIGTVVGRNGITIGANMAASNTRMQVTPLSRMSGVQSNNTPIFDKYCLLEIAASSLSDVAKAVQLTMEAKAANPRYKQFIPRPELWTGDAPSANGSSSSTSNNKRGNFRGGRRGNSSDSGSAVDAVNAS